MIDEKKLIEEYAKIYARNLVLYGVDVRDKLEGATQISLALEQAYLRGRQDESNRRWIPCSERLPSKEEYCKCNGQFIVTNGNRTYATYFDIYDTLRFGEPTINHFRIDRSVIAWQPLPKPYKESEE